MTTTLFLAFAIAAVASYFSILRNYFLLSIGAAVAWIALWAAIKDHPPVGVVEGESYHTIMMLACIVMAVVFPVISVGKLVIRQRDQSGSFSTKSSKLKFPTLFGNDDDDDDFGGEGKSKSMDDRAEEYRLRVTLAVRNGRKGRRR